MKSEEPRLFPDDDPSLARVPKVRIPLSKKSQDQARIFHGWTGVKLDLFRRYLSQYRQVAGGGTYVDGFAGTGTVKIDGERLPGSASIALNSEGFKSYHLYETPTNAAALNRHLQAKYTMKRRARVHLVPGDMNETLLCDLDNGVIPKDKPCFAMLDQNSTELNWTTVERLAGYKQYDGGDDPNHPKQCKVELWVLVNTHQSLIRLIPKNFNDDYAASAEAATLDRVFGGRDAWWDLTKGRLVPGQLANRYALRLKDVLGYAFAAPLLIRDPKNKRPHYYMVHASDHPAAQSIMDWARKSHYKDKSNTLQLAGIDRRPKAT